MHRSSILHDTRTSHNCASHTQQDGYTHHRRPPAGYLASISAEVLSRFLDEGVPEADVLYVATETLRCVRALELGEELPDQLNPFTREILVRYGFDDKTATLFMSLAGGRMVRL